mmetsp:Transcript_97562/g.259160  ORF Transcript_97562/g.259160 Transcript_97562/m.259160 type:complete len:253 (+) Transcript_97562:2-760(+)
MNSRIMSMPNGRQICRPRSGSAIQYAPCHRRQARKQLLPLRSYLGCRLQESSARVAQLHCVGVPDAQNRGGPLHAGARSLVEHIGDGTRPEDCALNLLHRRRGSTSALRLLLGARLLPRRPEPHLRTGVDVDERADVRAVGLQPLEVPCHVPHGRLREGLIAAVDRRVAQARHFLRAAPQAPVPVRIRADAACALGPARLAPESVVRPCVGVAVGVDERNHVPLKAVQQPSDVALRPVACQQSADEVYTGCR